MMTLQSETVVSGTGIETRTILPLEFEDIEELHEGEVMEGALRIDETSRVDPLVELEQRLRLQAERNEQQIEQARQQAQAELRSELESVFAEKLSHERGVIDAVVKRFTDERTKYFKEVEREVVKLALAIAARVLHREVSLDPYLLRGVIRVALEQLNEKSTVTLRVADRQLDTWVHTFAESSQGIAVVGDAEIQEGDCVLETSVGRIELGIKVQLEEIEKGFFDLLDQRPA